MIYTVEIGEQAKKDLCEIYEYIAYTLLSPENAAGQIDRLQSSIMKLDHNPKRYRSYEKEPWKSRGLRWMSVDNYIVFYIPVDVNAQVTVIRVLYCRRDIDARLREDTM